MKNWRNTKIAAVTLIYIVTLIAQHLSQHTCQLCAPHICVTLVNWWWHLICGGQRKFCIDKWSPTVMSPFAWRERHPGAAIAEIFDYRLILPHMRTICQSTSLELFNVGHNARPLFVRFRSRVFGTTMSMHFCIDNTLLDFGSKVPTMILWRVLSPARNVYKGA